MSRDISPSPSYTVQIRCLLPSNSSQPTSLIVKPDKSNPIMTTATKTLSSDSFTSRYLSRQTSAPDKTCNICNRLLYSFEEILLCRICHGSYHWRCVKPETISNYGRNDNYTCDKCKDNSINTNSPHRLINGDHRTKSIESIDSAGTPTKTIQNFEEQQQQQSPAYKTTKISELDDYLPAQVNGNEYQQQNSQYSDDNRTTRQIQSKQQQQQSGIESDEETDRSTMFQANYQYTPLKDYAAVARSRSTSDNNSNNYQNSSPDNSDRQPASRYGGGLQYTNHGYDPATTRVVEAPSVGTTNITSPTIDNLSMHNRPHYFTTTTNLDVKEKPYRQQQAYVQSTSFLAPNHEDDNDSSVYKSSTQLQTDRHSNVGSDSGIVMVNGNHQRQPSGENHVVEKKLTNLVEQLGKQLENDAQKLNEKLEIKLKDLESMINQQTFIIRRQDEVIENLKGKLLAIETERDHFRQRLSVHEQREQNEKNKKLTNQTEKFQKPEHINEEEEEEELQDEEEQQQQPSRKNSNTSSVITDNNKPSTKKIPAPRVDHQWSTTNDERPPVIAKFVKNIPINRERFESDSSSAASVTAKLVSSVPVVEHPPASSRLDNIIHQSNPKDIINPSSSNYSLAQVRHQDRPHNLKPIVMEQEQIITTVHHDDSDNSDDDDDDKKKKPVLKPKRSSSSSSTSSRSSLPVRPPKPTTTTTATINRTSNKFSSFESLQPPYQSEPGPKLTTRTNSLQFGTKPVREDELGSIYITPVESNHPAIQSNSSVKGWLRKQNRESFLKRIERFYCVLKNNALLMHKNDNDRTPYKAINLKGAKVLYYDDPKYGPSLELTWTKPSSDPKHYHLYAPNPQEADRWVTGIQTAIHNLDSQNRWQPYRMNT